MPKIVAMKRRIEEEVLKDVHKKMVLIAGPRQCGKTTLARAVAAHFKSIAYYNWDIPAQRKLLLDAALSADSKLWLLDEIHKYSKWKNFLKGLYDAHNENHSILVTGSARLDVFKKGGDSLQGRYFYWRLHPLTIAEVIKGPNPSSINRDDFICDLPTVNKDAQKHLLDLLQLGGFPEPFLSGSDTEAKRWRLSYGDALVREDIRNTERVVSLDDIERLYFRLPEIVGSPLSINGLARHLECAHDSVERWVSILEKMYSCFLVKPFSPKLTSGVKKEPKLYLWDWSRIESDGARLENLVALHLLRFIHWCEDALGERLELSYFRDVYGREVDFILMKKGAPWVAIEVKQSQEPLSKHLLYFMERSDCKVGIQASLTGTDYVEHKNVTARCNKCRIFSAPLSRVLAALA